MIRTTASGITRISCENAARVVRLRRAAPDLPLFTIWILAVEYQERDRAKESTTDLDALLALAPWRSELEEWKDYDRLTSRTGMIETMERALGQPVPTLPAAPVNLVWHLKLEFDPTGGGA